VELIVTSDDRHVQHIFVIVVADHHGGAEVVARAQIDAFQVRWPVRLEVVSQRHTRRVLWPVGQITIDFMSLTGTAMVTWPAASIL
jgi:hypothetical protein